MLADDDCKGSIASVLINGNVISSHTFEDETGDLIIAKITPLQQFLSTPAEANNVRPCVHARAGAWAQAWQAAMCGQNMRPASHHVFLCCM